MGTYNKGILGAFSGKIGPVVGANWRGKEVMRSLPRKGNRLVTANQLLQREKFKMVASFLKPINPVIKLYFGSNNEIYTKRNRAMSYLIKQATVAVGAGFEMDYPKVLISKGALLGVENGTLQAGSLHSLDISWTDNSGQGEALATDKLVVVVYEPTSETSLFSLHAGNRNSGAAAVGLPAYFSGLTVQVWATFASVDDKRYATSSYLGTLLIS